MTNLYKVIGFILFCLIIGASLTILAEQFDIFPIKQEDIASLINTIWQVHAGVATTSIAILALITGLNKEKKYGYKTLDFMLNINRSKFSFRFHEEIIITLLLLFIQYLFVATLALAGSVFLFSVAGYFILRLFYCSIKITLFEEKVNDEIKNFILEKCRSAIEIENIKLKNTGNPRNG
ncbi:hypothetical protein [Gottfriedia luciferensis]|uniref:hypothetical protein n=1 Tax=Gottfriedia luciferensis TaxID=178774 RepID=UPI000B44824B|nr:hypothetical protein [Gottfriedia luciferensis]